MEFRFQLEENAPLPIYAQLETQLRRMIEEKELRDGDMLPSVQILARSANVSVRTMDRALKQLIHRGICFRRPKKGTFVGRVPNEAPSETKQVAILYVPSFGLEYFNTDQADRALYSGMRREASMRGIDLLLVNNDLEYYLQSDSLTVRGVLLLESEPLEELEVLAARFPQVRFVYANYFLPGFESTSANVFGVFNDDFGGAFQISSYFLARGYRNPRIFTFATADLNYAQRLKGFQFAADQVGISLEGRYTTLPTGSSLTQMLAAGREAARSALEEDPGIDLILCTCDFLSFGVYDYLKESGHGSVHLAGYDGYRLYGNFPEFPTMQIDFPEIGAQALAVATSRRAYPKQIKIFPNFVNQETKSGSVKINMKK